jgi:hypothetical protein
VAHCKDVRNIFKTEILRALSRFSNRKFGTKMCANVCTTLIKTVRNHFQNFAHALVRIFEKANSVQKCGSVLLTICVTPVPPIGNKHVFFHSQKERRKTSLLFSFFSFPFLFIFSLFFSSFSLPSPYLPLIFPLSSPYLPLIFPLSSPYLPLIFPLSSPYLPLCF